MTYSEISLAFATPLRPIPSRCKHTAGRLPAVRSAPTRARGFMAADLDAIADSLAGRYTIERAIGSGGMATVYRAHDVRHDRPVALKVLRPELSAVIGAERFLREIRTTANLQHPHILPLFDSGEAGGLLFYVMPFVAGGWVLMVPGVAALAYFHGAPGRDR